MLLTYDLLGTLLLIFLSDKRQNKVDITTVIFVLFNLDFSFNNADKINHYVSANENLKLIRSMFYFIINQNNVIVQYVFLHFHFVR